MPDSIQKQGPPISPWQKLLRQRVIQTLALYIPIGWILNEIVIAASENFTLPGWVTSGALILFIAGIPVVAFVSWAFQWTESGVVADVKGWRDGDGKVFLDWSARYSFTETIKLRFGVSNLLDKDPILLADNGTAANTAPQIYDVFGRRFFLGLTLSY